MKNSVTVRLVLARFTITGPSGLATGMKVLTQHGVDKTEAEIRNLSLDTLLLENHGRAGAG